MALIADYLARRLLHENHPTLEEERCLNHIQSRNHCGICEAGCPRDVFRGEDPEWDLCDGCGVCVTACPTQALRPAAMTAANILEVCGRVTGDMTTVCAQREGDADLKLPCLASMPWELIAFFALGGQISLLHGNCGDCNNAALMDIWQARLGQVCTFLGQERFDRSVLYLGAEEAVTARGFSRRDMFSLLFSKSKSILGGVLPDDKELSPDGTFCRALLAHRVKQRQSGIVCHWSAPAFNDSCIACGLCSRLCPTSALHRVGAGKESDVGAVWSMAVIPWRCTGCGICQEVCKSGGIGEIAPRALEDPTQPIVAHRSPGAWSRLRSMRGACRGEYGYTLSGLSGGNAENRLVTDNRSM